MHSFDQFRSDLQSALLHLHSADHRFSEQLGEVLGCEPGDVSTVQSTLIQWIRSLAPPPDTPEEGRSNQLYLVLHHRYVLGMTQEETAHTLYISPRTLQRQQRNGVHMVARRIWDAYEARAAAGLGETTPEIGAPATWEKQLQQELRSLQQSTTEAACDLQAALQGARRIAVESVHHAGISLSLKEVPENCPIQLHLSIAEQVVLMVLTALEQIAGIDKIDLTAAVKSECVDVVFETSPVTGKAKVDLAFAQDLIEAQGGGLTISPAAPVFTVTLHLPRLQRPSNRRTVLIVDDNTNLVTLYASYCIDTDYDVIHLGQGSRVVEVAGEMRPDVILLDVLLPDVNGWQLLMDLRTAPATRGIPIIVCSVITDARMALSLGAALYLQKPVWRQPFLDALQQVLKACPTTP